MSKLAALKNTTGKKTTDRLKDAGTSEAVLDALSGSESSPQRKARAKTNRTIPFATRVSSEFDDEFRRIAFEGKLKHAESMEKMLALYKKHKL